MKASLKVLLRKNYKTKEGKHQVCLRYTAYRRFTFIGFNVSVHSKDWNENKKQVKATESRHLLYNRIIKEQYHKAEKIILDNFLTPLPVKEFIERLKDKYYGNTDFYTFIENEIELIKSSRTKGTIDNYQNLINKMKEWKPTLSFAEITLEYIQRFHDYELKVGNLLSTIYKKHANFKFLLGLAVDKEQLAKNPYDKFEIKKITKAQNNDILTEDELEILQQTYDSNRFIGGKREVLRDFLFSCYTSLSYAEFHYVTYADLRIIELKSKESYLLLCNERQKTSIPYKIPIVSPVVSKLLRGEKDFEESFEKIFQPLTNQPTNRYLKEIMKDQKIDKIITFHRETYITSDYGEKGYQG